MDSQIKKRTYLGALLALAALLTILTWRPNARNSVREFRGTLHSGIRQIGGETTGVIIVTSEGAYELDLRGNPEWRAQLPALNGSTVIVRGRLTIGSGIEVRRRRVVHVVDLTADASSADQSKAVSDEDRGNP